MKKRSQITGLAAAMMFGALAFPGTSAAFADTIAPASASTSSPTKNQYLIVYDN